MTDEGASGRASFTRRRALQLAGAGSVVGLAGCGWPTGSCDLSVSKEHIGETATHGGSTEFEITVCNDGDATCEEPVTVIDELPAGVTFATESGSGWDCTENGGVVTCEHPNGGGLASGDCLPVLTLAVDVGSADEVGNEIENCVSVEQGNADAGNKQDCITVPVEPVDGECDLAITKTYRGDAVTEGNPATFAIEVCNEGDGPCEEPVTVVDGLPSGLTFASGSGSGWTASESGGVVTATHDNTSGLAPGDCLPVLELTVDIGSISVTGDRIRNCVSLRVENENTENDRDCVDVPVNIGSGECDLAITKSYDGDAVTEGGPATFLIEVCNEGNGPCREPVTVVDGLPSGVSFASGSGGGWTVSETGGNVTATHDNSSGLAPGECLPILELTVDVGAIEETGDRIRNCASLKTENVNPDNDTDCVDVPVLPGEGECDLAITKRYDGDAVTEGGPATFLIEVCNEGDGPCAEPVTVVDGLPSGVTFASGSGSGWTVSESGGNVTATHDNTSGLAPGDCLPVLELTVDVGSIEETGDRIRNCASLKTENANTDNDTDCVDVPVVPSEGECDLAITKRYRGDTVTEGEVATFVIEVCNEGDGPCAEPVTVVDGLPSGVTFASGSGSGWSVSESGGNVTATHDNTSGLAPGECLPILELEVDIGAIEETGDRIRNCASLKTENANTDNDTDCVDVPVLPDQGECDLAITKRHTGGDVVEANTTTAFEIVVCNRGDGPCNDQVTVADSLPSGVTLENAGGSGWSVSASGGNVSATHGNSGGLAPGDCLPVLTLEVLVGSIDETGDQIRNCARIDHEDPNGVGDANADNDTDCVTVTVTQPTSGCDGLEITKATGSQFNYGQQETYEITVCNPTRQDCDSRIRVRDDLPDGISFVSHSGSGWSVSESGGVVTASHPNNGTLTGGNCLPTLTLTVEVAPVDQFPGGSDGVRNCAQLLVDGVIVDEGCVTHVITN